MRRSHHWIPLSFCSCLLFGHLAQAAPPSAALEVGAQAPAFKLRTLDGSLIRLDELAYQGRAKAWAPKRPLLIDFFRTDCRPCRRSMPELIELHRAHAAQGLRILLVALLEEKEGRTKLERYLLDVKPPFTVVVDETEHFSKKFLGDSVALPATFLLDRTGVIRQSKFGSKTSMKEHFGAKLKEVMETSQ